MERICRWASSPVLVGEEDAGFKDALPALPHDPLFAFSQVRLGPAKRAVGMVSVSTTSSWVTRITRISIPSSSGVSRTGTTRSIGPMRMPRPARGRRARCRADAATSSAWPSTCRVTRRPAAILMRVPSTMASSGRAQLVALLAGRSRLAWRAVPPSEPDTSR